MKGKVFLAFLFFLFLVPLILLGIYAVSGTWQYPDLLPESLSLRSLRFIESQGQGLVWSIFSSIAFSLSTALLSFVI